MSAYLTFEATVEPMPWGKAVYTVLRLPADVAEALAAQGARRVEGEINDHSVNLALSRAPVFDGTFLWAGKSLLDRIGLAPGEPAEVRLCKADAEAVETPADLDAALLGSRNRAAWDALSPGKRRGLLHGIESAKRSDTRARRIDKVVRNFSDVE